MDGRELPAAQCVGRCPADGKQQRQLHLLRRQQCQSAARRFGDVPASWPYSRPQTGAIQIMRMEQVPCSVQTPGLCVVGVLTLPMALKTAGALNLQRAYTRGAELTSRGVHLAASMHRCAHTKLGMHIKQTACAHHSSCMNVPLPAGRMRGLGCCGTTRHHRRSQPRRSPASFDTWEPRRLFRIASGSQVLFLRAFVS